ncbi:MAG: hypothetical protein IPM42_01315 [Saprospiraceae bacterium]|nr:hypothetical protein [Saprospiraceae bacterium]
MKIETLSSFNEKVTKLFRFDLKLGLSALVMFMMLSFTSVNAQYVSKEIALQRINVEMTNVLGELNNYFPFTDQHTYLSNLARYYKLVFSDIRFEDKSVADAIEFNLNLFPVETASGATLSADASGSASSNLNYMNKADRIKMEKTVKELLTL